MKRTWFYPCVLLMLLPWQCNYSEPAATQSQTPNATAAKETPEASADSNDADEEAPEAEPATIAPEGWGDLRGRFVVSREDREKLLSTDEVDPDNLLGPQFDDTLIIGPTGGLANVFVWLVTDKDSDQIAMHPSYDETAQSRVRIVFNQCRCEPRVALLRTSQTLEFENWDELLHDPRLTLWNNVPH